MQYYSYILLLCLVHIIGLVLYLVFSFEPYVLANALEDGLFDFPFHHLHTNGP